MAKERDRETPGVIGDTATVPGTQIKIRWDDSNIRSIGVSMPMYVTWPEHVRKSSSYSG
jgi:hypothetical protein